MIRRANVIATFSQDGRIRPLWFKLSPDEKAPAYKVLSCACDRASWGGRIIYLCQINVAGKDMEVRLEYNVSAHNWDLVLNNSSVL